MKFRRYFLIIGFILASFSACDCGETPPSGVDASLANSDAGFGDAALVDGQIDADAMTDAGQAGDAATESDASVQNDAAQQDAQVENQPPVATAGEDVTLFPGATTTLTGVAFDPDETSDSLQCEWSHTAVPVGVTYTDLGDCQVMLSVNRDLYLCGSNSVILTFAVTDSAGATSVDEAVVTIPDERGPYVDNSSDYAGQGDTVPHVCCGSIERPCNNFADALVNTANAVDDGVDFGSPLTLKVATTENDYNLAVPLVLEGEIGLDCGYESGTWTKPSDAFVHTPIRFQGAVGLQIEADDLLVTGCDIQGQGSAAETLLQKTAVKIVDASGVILDDNILVGVNDSALDSCQNALGLSFVNAVDEASLTLRNNDISGGVASDQAIGVEISGGAVELVANTISGGDTTASSPQLNLGLRDFGTGSLTLTSNSISGLRSEETPSTAAFAYGAIIGLAATSQDNTYRGGYAGTAVALLLDGDVDNDGSAAAFTFSSQGDEAQGGQAFDDLADANDARVIAVQLTNQARLEASDLTTGSWANPVATKTVIGISVESAAQLDLRDALIETGASTQSSVAVYMHADGGDVFASGSQLHAGNSDVSSGQSTALLHAGAELELQATQLRSGLANASYGLWNYYNEFQSSGCGDSLLHNIDVVAGDPGSLSETKSVGIYHSSGVLDLSNSSVSATASHGDSIAVEMRCMDAVAMSDFTTHRLQGNTLSSSAAAKSQAFSAYIGSIHVSGAGCGSIQSSDNHFLAGATFSDGGSHAIWVNGGNFSSLDDVAHSAGGTLSPLNLATNVASYGAYFINSRGLIVDNMDAQAGAVSAEKSGTNATSIGLGVFGFDGASLSHCHLAAGAANAAQQAKSAGLYVRGDCDNVQVSDSTMQAGDALCSVGHEATSAGLWVESTNPVSRLTLDNINGFAGSGDYSYGALFDAEIEILTIKNAGALSRLGVPNQASGLVAGEATMRSVGLNFSQAVSTAYIRDNVIVGGNFTELTGSVVSSGSYGLYVGADFKESHVSRNFIFSGDGLNGSGRTVGIYTPSNIIPWADPQPFGRDLKTYFDNNVIRVGDALASYGVLTTSCVGDDMRFLHNNIHAGGASSTISAAVRFGAPSFMYSIGLCENLPVFVGNILDAGQGSSAYGFYESCGTSFGGVGGDSAAGPTRTENNNFVPGSGVIFVHDSEAVWDGAISSVCEASDWTSMDDVNLSSGPYRAASASDKSWNLDPEFTADGYHLTDRSPMIGKALTTVLYWYFGIGGTIAFRDIDAAARTTPFDIGCDQVAD